VPGSCFQHREFAIGRTGHVNVELQDHNDTVVSTGPRGGEVLGKDWSFPPSNVLNGYICARKWKKFSKRYLDKWCLVSSGEAREAAAGFVQAEKRGGVSTRSWIRVEPDVANCISADNPHQMKLCSMKGKADFRVSLRTMVEVPKSCFALDNAIVSHRRGKTEITVLEPAVDATECTGMLGLGADDQSKWSPAWSSPDSGVPPGPPPARRASVQDSPRPIDLDALTFAQKMELWSNKRNVRHQAALARFKKGKTRLNKQ
jgi:hypothetical protein